MFLKILVGPVYRLSWRPWFHHSPWVSPTDCDCLLPLGCPSQASDRTWETFVNDVVFCSENKLAEERSACLWNYLMLHIYNSKELYLFPGSHQDAINNRKKEKMFKIYITNGCSLSELQSTHPWGGPHAHWVSSFSPKSRGHSSNSASRWHPLAEEWQPFLKSLLHLSVVFLWLTNRQRYIYLGIIYIES